MDDWTAISFDDIVVSTEYIGPISTAATITGDLNLDGKVDIQDVRACVNVILGAVTDTDVIKRAKEVANPLTECNVLDVQEIVGIILKK